MTCLIVPAVKGFSLTAMDSGGHIWLNGPTDGSNTDSTTADGQLLNVWCQLSENTAEPVTFF